MTNHFSYDIKAHPTKYRGVQFRSRLEARWAAFFDILGWTWEYEPFDLNGWSPDFLLKSKAPNSRDVLCEVKPLRRIHDLDDPLLVPLGEKIIKATDEEEVLILGLGPMRGPEFICYGYFLGILACADLYDGTANVYFDHAIFTARDCIDFSGWYGSWHARLSEMPGSRPGIQDGNEAFVGNAWLKAGNLTQWRGVSAFV